MKKLAALVLLIALTPGCGSIAHLGGFVRSQPYGGVITDAEALVDVTLEDPLFLPVVLPLAAIDLPLCAVIDTVTLPVGIKGCREQRERDARKAHRHATRRAEVGRE